MIRYKGTSDEVKLKYNPYVCVHCPTVWRGFHSLTCFVKVSDDAEAAVNV